MRGADIDDLELTNEDLRIPDADLGVRLLSLFIITAAKRQGIATNAIGVEFSLHLIERLPTIKTERHDLSTLETAVRLAANGNVEQAGRLLKSLMIGNAINIATVNPLFKELRNKVKGPKAGGAKTARLRKEKLASRNAEICCQAE